MNGKINYTIILSMMILLINIFINFNSQIRGSIISKEVLSNSMLGDFFCKLNCSVLSKELSNAKCYSKCKMENIDSYHILFYSLVAIVFIASVIGYILIIFTNTISFDKLNQIKDNQLAASPDMKVKEEIKLQTLISEETYLENLL